MKKTLILLVAIIAMTMRVHAVSHIYRGNSTYTSDIIATWDGKHLLEGRSTYSSDILYTISGKHVYRGRSTYTSDILYTFSGHIPIPVLLTIL